MSLLFQRIIMISPSQKKRKRNWNSSLLPFPVDYNDHFETPKRAYEDVLPLLDFLQSGNKTRSQHRIYDPYYCQGRAKELLQQLGFHKVIHECRDFYQDIQNNQVPSFDTFLTNPPYSDQHKERCLQFAFDQLRKYQKPFLLLMPNYVAARQYYRQLLTADNNNNTTHKDDSSSDVLYLLPSERYDYDHPEGTGHDASPFDSIWYVGIGRGRADKAMKYWNEKHSSSTTQPRLVRYHELCDLGAIPTAKRPNPKRRRKKQRKIVVSNEISSNQPTQQGSSSIDDAASTNSKFPSKKKKSSRYRDQDGKRTKKRF